MESCEIVMEIVETCIRASKWSIKPSSKRRLHTDILALCTGMRAVVLVDYGGKLPELQERLCLLLKLMQKESPIFQFLRVMVIEEMIYLIHVKGIAELASSSLNSDRELLFMDLDQDPPKMITQVARNPIVMQLVSIQKLFALFFPVNGTNCEFLSCKETDRISNNGQSVRDDLFLVSQSPEFIKLSHFIEETQVTMPTLNGWLLGYPIVYLLNRDHVAEAIHNLSTKSLHLFKVLIRRKRGSSSKEDREEELMSFSVPCDLSLEEGSKAWAQVFESRMQEKLVKYKQIWSSLRVEITNCHPQAATIVL